MSSHDETGRPVPRSGLSVPERSRGFIEWGAELVDGLLEADLARSGPEVPGIRSTMSHSIVERTEPLQSGAPHQLDTLVDHPLVRGKQLPPDEGDPSCQVEGVVVEVRRWNGGLHQADR